MKIYALMLPLLFAASAEATPNVRISNVAVYDDGSISGGTSITSLDVLQDSDCDESDFVQDAEPFSDSTINFTVKNDSAVAVRFNSYSFSIVTDAGTVRSAKIAFVGRNRAAPNESVDLHALFLHAFAGHKYFNAATAAEADLGVRNVTFTLYGSYGKRKITLRRRVGLAFADYDRCN